MNDYRPSAIKAIAALLVALAVSLTVIPANAQPYQRETPPQYMARWEVYCVSQPPAQRAECRAQAQAQTQLYSANYQAAVSAESLRQTQETLRKLKETPRSAPAIR
jgi:hypothetical protein